jgi:hypothetical protein
MKEYKRLWYWGIAALFEFIGSTVVFALLIGKK